MDVLDILDSWVTLVAVTGHHCSQHSLENPSAANHGRAPQFPQTDRQPSILRLALGGLGEHPNRCHPTALVSPPGLPRQTVCEPPERQLCQGACHEHGSCQRLCRRSQSDLKSQVKREVSLFKYQMPSFILISLG